MTEFRPYVLDESSATSSRVNCQSEYLNRSQDAFDEDVPAPRSLPPSNKEDAERVSWDQQRDIARTTSPPDGQQLSYAEELEEFEAIRRKYFLTLERLRFAKPSDVPRGKFNDASISTRVSFSCLKDKDLFNANSRESLRAKTIAEDNINRPETAPDPHRAPAAPSRSLHKASLPGIRDELALGRQEQVALARKLRPSVLLDAANEALYKLGHRVKASESQAVSPTTLSTCPTMEVDGETHCSTAWTEEAHDEFYDSFRWFEEDDDLDLRLHLDDYHANLREALPVPKRDRRPSFRRHLSISKLPFGRSSMSLSRPATSIVPITEVAASPPQSQHVRRKSRALSLITPSKAARMSAVSIDHAAAHYRDPEARSTLRTYLTSPQKFDEAIEFGFPSHDMMQQQPSGITDQQPQGQRHGHTRGMLSNDSERFKTFFADDRSSTYSDDASVGDPESPRTPNDVQKHPVDHHRPHHNDLTPPTREAETFAMEPARASREMTMRMTLTRPDLRAGEDQMYRWQREYRPSMIRRLSQATPRHEDTSVNAVDVGPKENVEKFWASLDENEAQGSAEGGVVKRFWNRVRRG